jgi:fructokinase
MSKKDIICFGETLWDVFPNEKRPGGAPMNVAVHLRKFGFQPKLISRVGNDELGKRLLDFLAGKGIDTQDIQTDDTYPTGVVNVRIAANGDAKYDIVFPSAWDFISYSGESAQQEKGGQILVFGSLASRNDDSQNTLFKLLQKTDVALFDVNFREPYYSRSLIELLLHKSDIVKLNEHELRIIGVWLGMSHDNFETVCHKMAEKYSLPHIILTMGGEGALVLRDDVLYRQKGFSVKVKDTVGSGDSFLASYLAHFVKDEPVEKCLKMACATGAFVASSHGAVPDYDIEDILRLIKS